MSTEDAIVQLAARGAWKEAASALDAMSIGDELRTIGALCERTGVDVMSIFSEGALTLLERLRAEGGTWAVDVASAWVDRTRAMREAGEPLWKWEMGSLPSALVFLSLARAGVPILPEWEPLFPPADFVFGRPRFDLVVECARALPRERLRDVLAASAQRYPVLAVETALAVLDELDAGDVAHLALRLNGPGWSRRRVVERLEELAATRPNVRAALDHRDGSVPPPRLVCVESRAPRGVDDLREADADQLAVAGKAWDGLELPADARLEGAGAEASMVESLEIRRLADASGKHLYDAILVGGDSGTIFAAGTTDVIASIVQGAVQTTDDALGAALDEVLLPPPPSVPRPAPAAPVSATKAAKRRKARAAAKKVTAKKVKATKKAGKNPSAKKSAAKRTGAKKAAKSVSIKKPAKKPIAKRASAKKRVAKKALGKPRKDEKLAAKAVASKKPPRAKPAGRR